ncbi:MAG: 23S rRNA (uracil(1939)-C(5))-methyltransferase RlmD [Kiritimatiellia bacterium]
MNPAAGDQIELQIHDIARDDRWVGRGDSGHVYFVRGPTAPGERVRVKVSVVKKSFIEAELVEILQPSPARISPPCPYFGKCGGCQLQHIRYDEQLRIKQKVVCDALERLGRFAHPPVEKIISSAEEYRGRNKIEFVFTKKGRLAFHGTDGGSIVPVDRCLLIPDILNRLLDVTARFFSALPPGDLQACNPQRMMLRRAAADGRVMVVLQMHGAPPALMQNCVESILRVSGKDRTTIVSTTGAERKKDVLHGSGMIEEKLGKYRFIIGPDSFFQTSTRQAEKLCETVAGMSRGGKQNLALDLFCGTGPMAHYLSAEYARVIGVDGEKSAIENAVANARLNGCANIRFEAKALDRIAGLRDTGCPDLVVMDPPRNGIHADALKDIMNLGAAKMIYVSCNSATFARDARQICDNGSYRLARVQPLDMFPQTSHIETVSLFQKKN